MLSHVKVCVEVLFDNVRRARPLIPRRRGFKSVSGILLVLSLMQGSKKAFATVESFSGSSSASIQQASAVGESILTSSREPIELINHKFQFGNLVFLVLRPVAGFLP